MQTPFINLNNITNSIFFKRIEKVFIFGISQFAYYI